MDPFTEYLQEPSADKDPFSVYLSTDNSKSSESSAAQKILMAREKIEKIKSDIMNQLKYASSGGRAYNEALPAFGKGVASGATLGAVNMDTDTSSRLPRYAHTAGEFVGAAVPITAASTVAGALAPAAGPALISAIAGPIYEGAKGFVQNQAPGKTLENAAISAALSPILTKGGEVVSTTMDYLKNVFGKEIGPRLGNWFLGTLPRIAEERRTAGKPDLFTDATNRTGLFGEGVGGGNVSRNEVQQKAQQELGKLQNQSKFFMASPETTSKGNLISADKLGPVENLLTTGQDLLREYSKNPYDPEKIKTLQTVVEATKSGQSLPLQIWNNFKDILDDELRPIEQAQPYGALKHAAAAIRTVADKLRGQIAEKYPELADNMSKQSLLLNILDSVKPFTRMDKNMPSTNAQNWISAAAKFATGNRLGAGAATVMTRLGEKSLPAAIPEAVGIAGKKSLSDLINEYNQ